MDNERKDDLIDLYALAPRLLRFLRRGWLLLLILAALFGGLMAWRSIRNYVPMYRSEAMFTVSVNYSGSTDLEDYSYYFDKSAAQLVTDTFPYLLRSQKMNELICQRLGTQHINGHISALSSANTNLFTLTVSSTDPNDAYEIICAVIDVYPLVSRQVVGETQLVMTREPNLAAQPFNSLNWQRGAAAGALAGFALGLVLLLILALLRKTVLSQQDVRKILNLPCLACIPEAKRKKRGKNMGNSLLISRMDSSSAFCESFRLLRLKLSRCLEPGQQVIMFTSTVPAEGKSSLAVNTALTLAKDNKKVLLVDADMRGPNIKALLNMRRSSLGMAEYLSGKADRIEFLRFEDSNLRVFAGDEPLRNPTPLLRKEKIAGFISALRGSFDYIIIDTPPCGIMADAAAICPYVDKVVYVIRRDFAPASRITDGVQSLSAAGADICGFVFNRSEAESGSAYGYGYGYGRGYGYGYTYGKNKK